MAKGAAVDVKVFDPLVGSRCNGIADTHGRRSQSRDVDLEVTGHAHTSSSERDLEIARIGHIGVSAE